jgi:gas vesicle protein
MTEFFIGMTVGVVVGSLALAYLFASTIISSSE